MPNFWSILLCNVSFHQALKPSVISVEISLELIFFFYVMKFEIWNSNLFFSETQTKPASDSSGDEDSDDENQNGPVEVMLFSLIYFCFWMFKLQFCICQYFLKK